MCTCVLVCVCVFPPFMVELVIGKKCNKGEEKKEEEKKRICERERKSNEKIVNETFNRFLVVS